MFTYDIYFELWDDLYDFEFLMRLAGVDFEIGGIGCDRLYVYGNWEDADIAESIMCRHGISFWEVYM